VQLANKTVHNPQLTLRGQRNNNNVDVVKDHLSGSASGGCQEREFEESL